MNVSISMIIYYHTTTKPNTDRLLNETPPERSLRIEGTEVIAERGGEESEKSRRKFRGEAVFKSAHSHPGVHSNTIDNTDIRNELSIILPRFASVRFWW
jgi:hypothetical protein